MDWMSLVADFHDKFGAPTATTPDFAFSARHGLRIALIAEEYREYREAEEKRDLVGIADALADLSYVIVGAALEYGIPLNEVFAEVHRSNMTKLWEDGTVHRREDGKILKPPSYSPADIAGVLNAKVA